jgi:hypothetical protein
MAENKIVFLHIKNNKMGYYSERLRQRLEEMTHEQKQALWDKYSYLNEYGPVINSYCTGIKFKLGIRN